MFCYNNKDDRYNVNSVIKLLSYHKITGLNWAFVHPQEKHNCNF